MDNKNDKHELTLACRERASLTGVQKVAGASETLLTLVTACGSLTITGEKLKIVRYSEDTGSLEFEGVVNAIKYGGKKAPLLKRLFK